MNEENSQSAKGATGQTPLFSNQATGVEHRRLLARGISRVFVQPERMLLHQSLRFHCETRLVPDDTPVKVEVFRDELAEPNKIADFLAGVTKGNELFCEVRNQEAHLFTREHLEGRSRAFFFRFVIGKEATQSKPLPGSEVKQGNPVQFCLALPCARPVIVSPFVHSL